MIEEKVFFKNSTGLLLAGVLRLPSAGQSSPAIVSCHGFMSSKGSRNAVALAQTLAGKGFATLLFDFTGHGESQGSFEEVTVSREVLDLKAAIDFLSSQSRVDALRIGVIGSSLGGMVALIEAGGDGRVKALGLRAPVSDFKSIWGFRSPYFDVREWRDKGFIEMPGSQHSREKKEARRLNYAFYEDGCSYGTYDTAGKVRIPVLIIHGDKDEDVPLAQSRELARCLPNARLEVLEGATHFFTEAHSQKMVELFTRFFEENL